MKLLLDSHFLISIGRRTIATDYPMIRELIADEANTFFVSVCSLWELAIKSRLGKVEIGVPIETMAAVFERAGFDILDINRHHAVARIDIEPPTRDPFDRMLLAQCKVEGFQLVTVDRALVDHPLAWRPGRG